MANPANTALIFMVDDSGKTKSATIAANEAGVCFGASETTCFHGAKILPKAGTLISIDCQIEFLIELQLWECGIVLDDSSLKSVCPYFILVP